MASQAKAPTAGQLLGPEKLFAATSARNRFSGRVAIARDWRSFRLVARCANWEGVGVADHV